MDVKGCKAVSVESTIGAMLTRLAGRVDNLQFAKKFLKVHWGGEEPRIERIITNEVGGVRLET